MKRTALISLCTLTFGFGSTVNVQAGCSECWSCFCTTVSPYLKVAGAAIQDKLVEMVSTGLKDLQANKAQVFKDVLDLVVNGDASSLKQSAKVEALKELQLIGLADANGNVRTDAKDIVGGLVTSLAASSARSVEEKTPLKVLSVKEAVAVGKFKRCDRNGNTD